MNEYLIVAAVVFSAAIHATWHGLIKISDNKFITYSMINIFSGLFAVIYLAFSPAIHSVSYPWLAGSVLLHLVYKVVLIRAYEHQDFGFVFPIARGSAPIFILSMSLWLFERSITPIQMALIVMIGVLISLLAVPNLLRGTRSLTAVGTAVLTGLITASYTLVDGLGGKASGAPISFICWMYVFDALVFPPIAFYRYRVDLLALLQTHWRNALIAGVLSVLSYAIIVFAMSRMSIPVVSALRELNIVFAALIAYFAFKEKLSAYQLSVIVLIASCVSSLGFFR